MRINTKKQYNTVNALQVLANRYCVACFMVFMR